MIHQKIQEWEVGKRITTLVFDTTASNTGKHKGAAVLLHKLLKTPLFYHGCRHHVSELLAKNPWHVIFKKDPAPDVRMFVSLKTVWEKIDQTAPIKLVTLPNRQELVDLFAALLEKDQFVRGDYRELCATSIVLLGGEVAKFRFKKPGACHKARFMAFGLLALKLFAFSDQQIVRDCCFSEKGMFNGEQVVKLERFVRYALAFYIPQFLTCNIASDAPVRDLELYKNLTKFRDVDEALAESGLQTLSRHFWYLVPGTVVYSLFSNLLSEDEKSGIAAKLLSQPQEENEVITAVPTFPEIDGQTKLQDLITPDSWEFFKILNLPSDWLALPPTQWSDNENYQKAMQYVKTVKVVNDPAERGIKLASDYSKILSKDSAIRSLIYQVVEDDRARKPNFKKSTMRGF